VILGLFFKLNKDKLVEIQSSIEKSNEMSDAEATFFFFFRSGSVCLRSYKRNRKKSAQNADN